MQCDPEKLQMYLDEELDPQKRESLRLHLGECRACRQEMARLQLLWLELKQTEEVDLPMELPYFRQQIISQAVRSRQEKDHSEASYWDAQKLAWQPAIMGASYLPGLSLFSAAGRAAGSQLPRLKSGALALAKKLIFTSGDQKGGGRS